MGSPGDPILAAARCPRCGYDLRGAMATWQSACPLGGLCNECGLSFGWAEVLRPEKFEPPWCVEFIDGRRIVRGAAGTAWRSLRPFRFWSAMRMSMGICWRRLAAYWALLLILLLLCGAASQAMAAVRLRYVLERQWTARGYQVNHSYAAAVAEAVLTPWGATSSGMITHSLSGSSALPYPAPRNLYDQLSRWDVSWMAWQDAEVMAGTKGMLAVAFWLCLALPPAFVLLPVSRRRAKVRWAHVWRITCYGVAIPLLSMSAAICVIAVHYVAPWPPVSVGHALCRYLVIPMLVIWWAAAIRRYLRLPHAWLVAVLLSFVAILVPFAITVILARAAGQFDT